MTLTGIGTAVPAQSISQSDAARASAGLVHGAAPRALPALYRRSGVKRRHSVVLQPVGDAVSADGFYPAARDAEDRGPTTAARMERYAREAPALAASACRAALRQSGVAPATVTHLITVSCTGFAAPGCDAQLIDDLGLPRCVARTHLGFMGCHGLMNALRVANAFAAGDAAATVLICAVELCTLHHQYTQDPQQIVANALFSDGAAALVVQQGVAAVTDGGWQLRSQRSLVVPGTSELMHWTIGDHGFEMALSPRVPYVIRQTLNPWLADWLAEWGLEVADVAAWAVHPGGPRILEAIAAAAGFDPALLQPSQQILERCGNMSSPTVAFILERLQATGCRPPCVMLAFGPGLTIEAALLT